MFEGACIVDIVTDTSRNKDCGSGPHDLYNKWRKALNTSLGKTLQFPFGGISSVQGDIDCYFCVVSKRKWIFNNITCILVVSREI